ncbi:acetyl-coenzyme A synthetase [Mariprofundus aestuarium]|uniref:Acetyl-coenzyme A synthetase n=1 Tax=Mariprofundus aestuarium TaxID=1921086 RepID=A0A2K8L732_MARES|nr:acetate--CoA ligase [Mariprofundus aestuarium]ATX80764.1 acetyl-coenzyme A synthetase [Mariprofundus aestuarium]
MSEAITTVLDETRIFNPPQGHQGHIASMQEYRTLRQQFETDFDTTWRELAREHLSWREPFTRVLNSENAPFFRWFEDGKLNLSENCLDRHVEAGLGERTAIIWESEAGEVRRYSYNKLLSEVCRAANAMRELGVESGDRVIIYMPMIVEAAIAMLACTRIGAVHSVVFGAFSPLALRDRIEDAGAKLVITADGGGRRGGVHALKPNVDEALSEGCRSVAHVLVVRHAGNEVEWSQGRDINWHDALNVQPDHCEPLAVESEHPLFILYTSGSTGKPKGILHSTAGYLLWARVTMRWSFDFRPETDIFWCTADVGWITGHTYSVYGPLANGGTTLMYEGVPTYPDPGRLWKICADHGVTIFYTAPTAIRALNKAGDEWPNKHDLSSLRVLGTVGEPINPEAWMWYHDVIGKGRCPIVDTWWQTETGGHMLAPLPFATPTKPGSATFPLPGIDADIVDEAGLPITEGGGLLIIRKPWPSMLRGVWGDDQRYIDTYWKEFDGRYYFAGDGARRDEDGYFWVMGRVDDVLNVSGHRLGTMELESALVSHEAVAEAAVVGRPDAIKGEAICAFVVLKCEPDDSLVEELRAHVSKEIGAIAKPDDIRFADSLPKTRSGKIMRRLLRDIAAGREITSDISTLEDQSVVQKIQQDRP